MIGIQTDLRSLRLVRSPAQGLLDGKVTVRVLRQCPLTAHQVEVLKLAADGLDNPEISEQLGVTRRTVEAHMANIIKRTETRNRTAAAVMAVREGWI